MPETIYRKLKDLTKLANNPRVIRDNQFAALCESVKNNADYFFARPLILSDRTGELKIIAGNQRFEAAKYLKFKEVPTCLLSGLSEEREREIIIRDNVHAGSFDFDTLANEWNTDELLEWGLELTSFEPLPDLDKFFVEQTEEKGLKNKIVLEYTQEDFEIVSKELLKHGKSYEQGVWSVLGL